MKRTLVIFIFIILSCVTSIAAGNEIVLVVGKETPVESLTKSEVIDMFMGKYVAYPSGERAVLVELNDKTDIQENFYRKLTGRSISSINAYWARLKFTGRKREVVVKNLHDEAIDFISTTPYAIGYIPSNKLNDSLKVVYTLTE